MIRINDKDMCSLPEIREEYLVSRDPDTGRPLGRTAYFSSMKAMMEGAFHFVKYFGEMHSRGLVYGSSDPGPFFFDLSDGAFFCNGEDLFVPEGTGMEGFADPAESRGGDGSSLPEDTAEEGSRQRQDAGDQGTRLSPNEFTAPELLNGDADPLCWNMETDWYFMSVFLFEYFFHTGSPFEGKQMINHCFLSPMERELFRATEGIFCMEPGEHGNQPVPGIQDKLIRYWREYPDLLCKHFQRAFLSGGQLMTLRPTEIDWKQVLVQLMMDYIDCPCGFHGYSFRMKEEKNGIFRCPECGRSFYPLSDGLDRMLLTEGSRLFACQTGLDAFDYKTVTGQVIENKKKKGLFGIRNVGRGFWRGLCPDGITREIGHDEVMPIWEGMTLRFERGEDWTLRIGKPPEFYEERGENI